MYPTLSLILGLVAVHKKQRNACKIQNNFFSYVFILIPFMKTFYDKVKEKPNEILCLLHFILKVENNQEKIVPLKKGFSKQLLGE